MSFEAQRGMYLHPTYAITPVREPLGVLDAWMWAREPKDPDGTRPGIKENVRWGEGYARVADLAAELPQTRLVYVADRESDLLDLMVRARDLGNPADWLLRAKHESESILSPHNDSDDFGVKFTRVSNGRFFKGRNSEEANTIATAVEQHLLHRSEEALDKNRPNEQPFFITNLENVQGDERDVIFISCTYEPEAVSGKVFHRFGPINSDVGWRRLNVLFTRSKKRMHVFSSMGAEDILISASSKRGVIALKNFLAFVETGHLHQAKSTGKAPDSDFEVAVASALHQAGLDCEFLISSMNVNA